MLHGARTDWASRLVAAPILAVLVGCGPSFTYLPTQVHAIRSLRSCSQGPLDIELAALGAQRGERVEVYACSSHAIGGHYRLFAGSSSTEGSYGSEAPDNKRCVASAEVLVQETSGATSKGPPQSQHQPSKPLAAAKAAATSERQIVEVPYSAPPGWCHEQRENGGGSYSWTSGRTCACGLSETYITSMEWSDDSAAPLRAGGPLTIRLWSVEPNDLQGVTFVARQLALDPATSQKKWLAARKKERARFAAAPAHPASVDPPELAGPKGPPPPPPAETPPPQPSAHAEWIPGYWHFGNKDWSFIPGWWRVPEGDVAGGFTTHAPSAPPALRTEQAPPPSFAGAVWIPGQWQWSGREWVWVAGAWRLPPTRGFHWRAAAWRVGPSGVVLVPGGWVPGGAE